MSHIAKTVKVSNGVPREDKMFPIPPPRRFQHSLATFESVHKGDHNGVVGIFILLCYVFLRATIFPYQGCVVCWVFLMYLWCLIIRFSPFLQFACGGIWITLSHKIIMVDDYYSLPSLSPCSTWWHRCNVMWTRLQIMLPASLVCTIMHHYCMYL